MPLTTRSTVPSVLRSEITRFFGDGITHQQSAHLLMKSGFYDLTNSTRDHETYQELGGLGDHIEVKEGEKTPTDTLLEGSRILIINKEISLAKSQSIVFLHDNQWTKFTDMAFSFGDSVSRTVEKDRINLLLTNPIGYDAVNIFSDLHPSLVGTFHSNQNTVPATLSHASLAVDVTRMSQVRGSNGELIDNTPRVLLAGMQLWPEVDQLFRSILNPTNIQTFGDAGNPATVTQRQITNQVNSFGQTGRSMHGFFKGGAIIHNFLPDRDYFIRSEIPNGLIFQLREAPHIEQENDALVRSTTWVSSERHGLAVTNWRSIYKRVGG